MKSASRRFAIMIIIVIIMQGMMPHLVSHARPAASPQDAGALSLPSGKVGQNYEYQLRTEGGLPPFTWKVVGGELPLGITLEAGGKLKGIPTTPRREAYGFVIEVSDSSQPPQGFAQPFLLMIQAAPLRMVVAPQPLKIVAPGQSEPPTFTEVVAKTELAPRGNPTTNGRSMRPLSSAYVEVSVPTLATASATPAANGGQARKGPKAPNQPPSPAPKNNPPPAANGSDAGKDQELSFDTPLVGDKTVSGATEAGATVAVYRNALNTVNNSQPAGTDGRFEVKLKGLPLTKRDVILIKVTHKDGKEEATEPLKVTEQPDAPSLDPIKEGDPVIRGKARGGATVKLFRNKEKNATDADAEKIVKAENNGVFAFALDKNKPVAKGDKFRASQEVNKHPSELSDPPTEATDKPVETPAPVANKPAVDKDQKLVIDTPVVGDSEVTGKTKAKAQVQITVVKKDSNETEDAVTAGDDGIFSVSLKNKYTLVQGDKLIVQITPEGGKPEDPVLKIVADKPDPPSLEPITTGAELIRGKSRPKANIALYRKSAQASEKPSTTGGTAKPAGKSKPAGTAKPTGTSDSAGTKTTDQTPPDKPETPEKKDIPADGEGNFVITLDKDKPAKKGDKFQATQTVNGDKTSDLSPATEVKEEKKTTDTDCTTVLNISELHLGERRVSGSGAETGANVEVQVFRNITSGNPEATAIPGPDGTFIIPLTTPLGKDDLIRVRQKKGDSLCPFSTTGIVVVPMDLTHPNLIGLAPFGVVTSQQANSFSQADPFVGFIIGYMSTARHRYICRRKVLEVDPDTKKATKIDEAEDCKFLTMKELEANRPFFRAYEEWKKAPNADNPAYVWEERNPYKPHLNIRFQGIFESDGRTATAPVATSTPSTTTGNNSNGMPAAGTPVSFIASRKTFDVDLHTWYEWRFLHSQVLHIGPYAAIGGSFTLSKNELTGEGVAVDPDSVPKDMPMMGTGTGTGTGSDTNSSSGSGSIPLDTTKAVSTNGGKLYYEGGLALNFYNPDEKDSNLYVQAFLAYGRYEAFADLRPKTNTKNRGIGKLRVFPFGLNRDFFSRGVVTPMFGIDLNAGKGPDQVKFFIGTVLNITKFIDKLKGVAANSF